MPDEKYPARTELTVIPADPKQESIGFKCYEYLGTKVYRIDRTREVIVVEEPLLNKADLQVGMELAVPSLLGGYILMTVTKDKYGVLSAKGEKLSATLRFSEDDRKCWTCIGMSNMRAFERLTLNLSGVTKMESIR